MLTASCFSEEVPTRKKKSKHIDPELDELLGLIEKAWRDAGHENLIGLTYETSKDENGIVAHSTWYGWRDGSRVPKYLEILRVAREVGLDVGPMIKDGPNTKGGPTLTSKMRQMLTTMKGLPEHLQDDILDFAERHAKAWGNTANPPGADAAK